MPPKVYFIKHLYTGLIFLSLKERPISPPPGNVTPSQTQITNSGIPITSLPSPLQGSDSPIPGSSQQNVLVNNNTAGVGPNVTQSNVYRPQGMNPALVPQQKGVVSVGGGRIMGSNQIPIMQVPAPPGYHATTGRICTLLKGLVK